MLDEWIAGDLIGEPGAPRTQHAALAVQQNLREMLIGLAKVRLTSCEPGFGAAVGHRLVLQRALAALVAHRAVQRMVDQQQFHHAVLRLVGGLGRVLGAHHHARRRP